MTSFNPLAFLLQAAGRRRARRDLLAVLRHLGPFGLFLLAILDSTPLPTFGGADILNVILAARHREPWYVYAAATTLGSVIGAIITFRLARAAGSGFLEKRFGARRVAVTLDFFKRWGAGALVVSALVPLPFPTSAFFAAAGILDYPEGRFLAFVILARAVRYSALAAIASHYGRHFVRVFSHPQQYLGWLLLIACAVSLLIAGGLFLQRRLQPPQESRVS